MIQAVLYFQSGDESAERVSQMLQRLESEHSHELIRIDLATDPTLERKYGARAPVLEIGPYTLHSPIEEVDLKIALNAARQAADRSPQTRHSPWGRRLNRGLLLLTRHWLAVFNFVVFAYAGLPFAAPALMEAGATGPARLIYTVYSPFCHQLAFRSWFLFGEQAAYPRELAGTSLEGFGQATGIGEQDFLEARRFLGNEQIGYKVALCERDIGIYLGILGAGLIFSLIRGRLGPLPLKFWLLLGIGPIALDGGSQLISQLNILPIAARESTPFLRSLTGALFGVMNVWMAYPHVEEAMKETRDTVAAKLAVADLKAQTPR